MNKEFLLRAVALSSPLVWFASHASQFALARLTCLWHSNAILWVVSGLALLLDVASGLAARSELQRSPDASAMPRWLALSGMALSAGFFIVIVAQAIPSLILAGCE